jgi:DNA repair protein RadC
VVIALREAKTIKQVTLQAKRVPIAAEHRKAYSKDVTNSTSAAIAVRALLGDTDEESFVVITLDSKLRPLGHIIAAKGGLDSCTVDLRTVFRAAVVQGATGILVAHNHPSGDANPSLEDIALTRRLVVCGGILGVPLLDHIIVTDDTAMGMRTSHTELWKPIRMECL